ncbi:hypothetical protein AALO_G00037080 [Alosa alosa]|uniref:Uncharacterized protein n=1 Tax=Alosa alosa TaxID=278164 RepID=A0AAV6H6P0_9TELE|nr:hypothetical protein AALO_G00037080 [Alosa alosa]
MTIASSRSIFQAVHQKDHKTLTLLLLIFGSMIQALQIIGVDKEVIAGEDVELVCQLSGAEVVIQVDWMRTTPKTVQKKIFTIIRNRNTTPEEVDDLKTRLKFIGNIQEGVANILLKNASIKDCGNYSCRFTLFKGSPVKKSIQLTVHAPPVVNVLTVTPLVGISEVTLATCSADNAYPPAEVSWNASSLGSTVSITSISTVNPDGTSNVTCNLLGLPSRGIQRKEVLCLVRHPTLNGQQMFNYSINIHYPPDPAKVTTLQSPPPSVVFQCQTDANPEDVQYKWRRARIPFVSLDREVSFFTRGGSGGIVAPPRALRERLTRRAQVRSKVAYRRLKDTGRLMSTRQEDGGEGVEDLVPETDGEKVSDAPDFASVFKMLQRAVSNQEKEAVKQEQRWRNVQVQLNTVHGELEEMRARVPPAAPGAVPGVTSAMPADAVVASTAPPAVVAFTAPPAAVPVVPLAAHPATVPAGPSSQPATLPASLWMPAAPQHPVMNQGGPAPATWTRASVPKMEEGDDVEQYMTTFERLAAAYRWPPADWATFLVPYLTGKARAAYVAMDPADARDYLKVKDAILAKFEINCEVYRQRFRDPRIQPGETPREFYNRIKDLYTKWMKPTEKTVEEIGETLILEQFLRSLAPDVRVWVKEHDPQTGQ